MKTLFLTLILSFIGVNVSSYNSKLELKSIPESDYAIKLLIAQYKMVIGIAKTESEFNPKVVNVSENAAGLLQIRPIMRKEVNRILGKEVYTDSCRFSVQKSIEMFLVVQAYYNPKMDAKKAALLWNCGTTHPKGDRGKIYWKKVKTHLKLYYETY